MEVNLNPLTWVILLITYFVLAFKTVILQQYVWLLIILLVPAFLMNVSFRSIVRRVRHILLFLPILFIFYVGLSLILSENTFAGTIQAISISTARILLIIFSMALFLELTHSMTILDSLRTLWWRAGIQSRRMEDFFQLLYLTFRFFPILREEVQTVSSLEKAFGLPPVQRRFKQIKQIASYLPGFVVDCLQRADHLAMAMEIRGYGRVLPRGIANPIRFHSADAFVLISLFFLMTGYIIFA